MEKFMKRTALFFGLLALAASAYAQTALVSTTLSAAVTATGANTVYVTSAASVLAPGLNQAQGGLGSPTGGPNVTVLYVDQELMRVNSVSGTTVRVERGYSGTRTSLHASGTTVYVGGASQFINYDRVGACTAATFAILPQVNANNGKIFNCPTVGPYANQWVQSGVTAPPGSYYISDNTAAGSSQLLMCHARYNFAVDGGAVSTITPAVGCTIPINAVIYRVLVNNVVAPIGSTGNVSVGLSAGGAGAAALLAATARGSLTVGTIFEGIPVAASASSSNTALIKMTAAGNVTVTIATNALTAGVLDIAVFYYVEQA